MTTEFKVLPWLRALRDRNACEETGLADADVLERTRQRAVPVIRELQRTHPEAFHHDPPAQMRVAEKPAAYASKG